MTKYIMLGSFPFILTLLGQKIMVQFLFSFVYVYGNE